MVLEAIELIAWVSHLARGGGVVLLKGNFVFLVDKIPYPLSVAADFLHYGFYSVAGMLVVCDLLVSIENTDVLNKLINGARKSP